MSKCKDFVIFKQGFCVCSREGQNFLHDYLVSMEFWRNKHTNVFSQELENDEERKKFLPLPPAKSVLTHKGMDVI